MMIFLKLLGFQILEQSVQLAGGTQVGPRVHAAGQVLDGNVANPPSLQRRYVLTWRRGADHVPPCEGKRFQLRSQQQLQADVGGGDVQHGRLSGTDH